jgi:hypothetical protein
MRRFHGTVLVYVAFALGLVGWQPQSAFAAKEKKPSPPAAAGKKVNACGCYADTQGNCFCGRKGKCACAGECEPKGCEEKRAKEMDKEIAAETKKATAAEKKQRRTGDDDKPVSKSKTNKAKKKDKDNATDSTASQP